MISVLICCKNEAKNIADCIASVSDLDEIIVIDDFSTDGTPNIAKKLGAQVFTHPLNEDWSNQRNFGISKCTKDWIFIIDADERAPKDLINKLISLSQKSQDNFSYRISRICKFKHHSITHGPLSKEWIARFAPKEGLYYTGQVHEKLISPFPERKIFSMPLEHWSYPNLDSYYRKLDKYTKIAAIRNQSEGKKAFFLFDIIARPCLSFLKMFILKKGFLDGKLGLIFCINHSIYVCIKYIRLYYLNKNNGEL